MKPFRSRVKHVMMAHQGHPASEIHSAVANMMLNEMDGILVKYWDVLSDMGWPKSEYMKLKRLVKKRL